MSYYLFPKGNIQQLDGIFNITAQETPEIILSPSLSYYITELKEQTNTPEFRELQTIIFPYYRDVFLAYPDYTPEFFEIIEIIQTMHLNIYIDAMKKTCYSLNIYEFCTDIAYINNNNNNNINNHKTPQEKYLGIHAIQKIQEIRNNEPKHHYFLGNTNRNTYSNYSLRHFEETYLHFASKLQIILADTTKLTNRYMIIVQLCMILCTQAKKGILFWKVGDTDNELILDILFILSSFYEKMFFIKPFIMDSTKSEKYVVCRGFLYDNSYSIYAYLHLFVKKIQVHHGSISRILKSKIPFFFLNKLEEIHYIFGQLQLEQIHYILLLMTHKYKLSKLENIAKLNIQKTTDWINKHYYYLSNSIFSGAYLGNSNDNDASY